MEKESMSLARRTEIAVTMDGTDISADINKYLLQLTYTDNEAGKTDDLQISLDDREGVWLTDWLDNDDKGVEISARIIQKDWGNDGVLDCGSFKIDGMDGAGPPQTASIKATSLPFISVARTATHTKAWENITLMNLVRAGTVSSVDVDRRRVRVAFADKQDINGAPLISGELKVLQNQPLIAIEKWVMELGSENKWDYETEYNSHDRTLGLGEGYVKNPYESLRDEIKNEKTIKYEKRETIDENEPVPNTCCGVGPSCPLHGVIEHKKHRQTVTVYPWLPYVGQLVVCLYIPNGESDCFVIGGI